jgi:hypothetical protein
MTDRRYAANTNVAVHRSRAELEDLLHRFGASSFVYGWDKDSNRQVVEFGMTGRTIRMEVPMPAVDDPRLTLTPSGRRRTTAQIDAELDKEIRRRSFLAVVKAKLIAVDDGITSLEREFLSDMVMENGTTVHETVRPYLAGTGPMQLTRAQ